MELPEWTADDLRATLLQCAERLALPVLAAQLRRQDLSASDLRRLASDVSEACVRSSYASADQSRQRVEQDARRLRQPPAHATAESGVSRLAEAARRTRQGAR
jgi:hypothetical protein